VTPAGTQPDVVGSPSRGIAACAVCGHARNVREFLHLSSCSVDRCDACGFVFLGGTRSAASERVLYEDTDHFDGGYMEKLDIDRIVAEQRESVDEILRRVGGRLADLPADTPILDVGCARGHFLAALAGGVGSRSLVGLDVSSAMVARGRSEFGLDLRAGAVEDADLPKAHFGLITMFDVFEHVADPRATLAKLFASLRPGGFLILEVPSETTVFRVLARWGFRVTGGRVRGPLEQLYHRAHLSYFTKQSLARLIQSVGGERIAATTKEAHVTRFGLRHFSPSKRVMIRAVCALDRLLGTQAKLLVAFQRRAED